STIPRQAPDPGLLAFGPGPNEPAGLLPFYSWEPGVHGIDMTLGTGPTTSGRRPGLSSDWTNYMSIVEDSGTTSGYAMRQDWPVGTGVRAGNMSYNFSESIPDPDLFPGWETQLGELRELYVRLMMYIPVGGWTRNPNN